jgi:hypothetical protein
METIMPKKDDWHDCQEETQTFTNKTVPTQRTAQLWWGNKSIECCAADGVLMLNLADVMGATGRKTRRYKTVCTARKLIAGVDCAYFKIMPINRLRKFVTLDAARYKVAESIKASGNSIDQDRGQRLARFLDSEIEFCANVLQALDNGHPLAMHQRVRPASLQKAGDAAKQLMAGSSRHPSQITTPIEWLEGQQVEAFAKLVYGRWHLFVATKAALGLAGYTHPSAAFSWSLSHSKIEKSLTTHVRLVDCRLHRFTALAGLQQLASNTDSDPARKLMAILTNVAAKERESISAVPVWINPKDSGNGHQLSFLDQLKTQSKAKA